MKSVFLIPDGPKNLAALFPSVDWSQVEEYYVEVLDANGVVIATTPISTVCKCDDGVTLHFVGYCGTYDTANFLQPKITHEDQSSEFTSLRSYPLVKTDTGVERFNVSSNDVYEVRRKSQQNEMDWLQECKDSPKAFMEWKGIEGQQDSYIPIVILTGRMDKQKVDREWEYVFIIQFKLANEYGTVRN